MKKLMFATVAALCATVVVGEGSEPTLSTGVVGYMHNDVAAGWQGAGLTFIQMTEDSTLGNLEVTGYGDEWMDLSIMCCKLDSAGREGTKYTWLDNEEFEDEDDDGNPIMMPARHGWYLDDYTTCVNDTVTLSEGEAVWFRAPNSTIKLMSAGQVLHGEYQFPLASGWQYLANPTPVEITNISNVRIGGYGDEWMDLSIMFCKLDSAGREGTKYTWLDNEEFEDEDEDGNPIIMPARYGWYLDDYATSVNTSVTIKPGEAIWFRSPSSSLSIYWPSAY